MWCNGRGFYHLRQGDDNPYPFPKISKLKDVSNLQNFVKNWTENKKWSVSEKLAGLSVSLCTDGHVCGKSRVIQQYEMKFDFAADVRGPQIKENMALAQYMIRDDDEDMEEVPKLLERLRLMSKSIYQNLDIPHMEMLLYGVIIPNNKQSKTFKYMTQKKRYFENSIYGHSLGFLPYPNRADSELELLRKMPWLKTAEYNGKTYYLWHMDEKLADWFDKFFIEKINNYEMKHFQEIVQEGDENLEKQVAAGYVLFSPETKEMYQLVKISAKNEKELARLSQTFEEAKKTEDFSLYPWFKDEDDYFSDDSQDEEKKPELPKRIREYIDMSLFQ
jgi:hypothetical protein